MSSNNLKTTEISANIRQPFLNILCRVKFTRFGFSIAAGVDRRTAAAMGRLLEQITPSHSITSRRHSIATIIRSELDGEIERVIHAYRTERADEVLLGFRLSYAWLRSPEGHAAPAENLNAVAAANLRASQWRTALKDAVRDAQDREATGPSEKLSRFSQTMDSVIELIDVLSSLKPSHTHEGGAHGKRILLKALRGQQRYCDLCWRPTMFSLSGRLSDATDQQLGVSRRFCVDHDPQSAASNYRRDLAHKKAFALEVEHLGENWQTIRDNLGLIALLEDAHEPSGHQIHLAPVTVDRQDIRRAAYALIHAKLRGSSSQCWIMRQQGLPTQAIAQKMKLTQRAVRSALAAFEAKLAYADRIRLGFDGYA